MRTGSQLKLAAPGGGRRQPGAHPVARHFTFFTTLIANVSAVSTVVSTYIPNTDDGHVKAIS